jgi:hypothetical protein
LAKILLRSGYFDTFLALGESGQTIFDSALQIRETLRLRKQSPLADCLAVPQPNDSGDKIDWYAPCAGSVIPWAKANEKQRRQALSYLDNCLHIASQLSERSLASTKNAEQLFGSLLQHALCFPGCQHVYLIDEKPVLTFWGFRDVNTPPDRHPLACLHESMVPGIEPEPVAPLTEPPETIPELSPEDDSVNDPEPIIVTLSQPDAPLHEPVAPAPQEYLPRRNVWRKILWPILIIAFFIALLLAWPWLDLLMPPSVEEVKDIPTTMEKPVKSTRPVTLPAALATLPLQKAEITPPKIEEPKPAVPSPKDALVLPAEAVKAGTTKFLDGNWRVIFTPSDTVADIPTGMHLQISNDVGRARIAHADNFVCRAEVHFGLMQSGNLVIKPRSRTECFHGSHRHTVPEIICSQGLTGAALCNARYKDDIMVPVTFTRTGK